jgi:hypothetical protein
MLVFNILDNSSRLQRRICLFKKAAPCPVKKLNAPLSPFQHTCSLLAPLTVWFWGSIIYPSRWLAGWLAGKLDKIFNFLGKQSTKMGSRRSIKKIYVLIINQGTHLPTCPHFFWGELGLTHTWSSGSKWFKYPQVASMLVPQSGHCGVLVQI